MHSRFVRIIACLSLMAAPLSEAYGDARSMKSHVEEYTEPTLTMYARGIAALRSFDIAMHVTTYRCSVGVSDPHRVTDGANALIAKESRQRLSGGHYRVDLLRRNDTRVPLGNAVIAWDGERAVTYDALESRAVFEGHTPNSIGMQGIDYSQTYGEFRQGYSYLRMISDREDAVTVIAAPLQATIDIRAVAPRIVPANTVAVRLFLDRSRGAMPERIEHLICKGNAAPQICTVFENELSEVAPGVWAPVRSKRIVFGTDVRSTEFGKPVAFDVIELDRRHSSFNEPIDAGVFSLSLPPGTVCDDRINGTRFVIGSTTEDTYLDFLAARGRLSLQELQASESMPAVSHVIFLQGSWERSLLIVNVVILIGILAAAIRFLRRKRFGRSTHDTRNL